METKQDAIKTIPSIAKLLCIVNEQDKFLLDCYLWVSPKTNLCNCVIELYDATPDGPSFLSAVHIEGEQYHSGTKCGWNGFNMLHDCLTSSLSVCSDTLYETLLGQVDVVKAGQIPPIMTSAARFVKIVGVQTRPQ